MWQAYAEYQLVENRWTDCIARSCDIASLTPEFQEHARQADAYLAYLR